MISEDTGVGVKQYRDQKGAQQSTRKQCRCYTWVIGTEFSVHIKRVDEHG